MFAFTLLFLLGASDMTSAAQQFVAVTGTPTVTIGQSYSLQCTHVSKTKGTVISWQYPVTEPPNESHLETIDSTTGFYRTDSKIDGPAVKELNSGRFTCTATLGNQTRSNSYNVMFHERLSYMLLTGPTVLEKGETGIWNCCTDKLYPAPTFYWVLEGHISYMGNITKLWNSEFTLDAVSTFVYTPTKSFGLDCYARQENNLNASISIRVLPSGPHLTGLHYANEMPAPVITGKSLVLPGDKYQLKCTHESTMCGVILTWTYPGSKALKMRVKHDGIGGKFPYRVVSKIEGVAEAALIKRPFTCTALIGTRQRNDTFHMVSPDPNATKPHLAGLPNVKKGESGHWECISMATQPPHIDWYIDGYQSNLSSLASTSTSAAIFTYTPTRNFTLTCSSTENDSSIHVSSSLDIVVLDDVLASLNNVFMRNITVIPMASKQEFLHRPLLLQMLIVALSTLEVVFGAVFIALFVKNDVCLRTHGIARTRDVVVLLIADPMLVIAIIITFWLSLWKPDDSALVVTCSVLVVIAFTLTVAAHYASGMWMFFSKDVYTT